LRIPNYVFKRLRMDQVLLSFNLSLNTGLKFDNKSFCIRRSVHKFERSYLDLHLTNEIVFNMNKCVLKQLGSIFRRTRLFIINSNAQLTESDFICDCNLRLFLSYFNVLVKSKCPRFSSYCFNTEIIDDCTKKLEYKC